MSLHHQVCGFYGAKISVQEDRLERYQNHIPGLAEDLEESPLWYEGDSRRNLVIGFHVETAEMSTCRTHLRLSGEGGVRVFITDQPCCSDSWIEHVSSTQSLIGHTITDIRARKVKELTEESIKKLNEKNQKDYEAIATYGIEFVTKNGIMFIEFRNGSTGAYSGTFELYDINRNINKKILFEPLIDF